MKKAIKKLIIFFLLPYKLSLNELLTIALKASVSISLIESIKIYTKNDLLFSFTIKISF